ncbi:MAG: D-alanyl-D-alanine endopeptidase [Betaproteobacteria bacterium]|nr:D-alanyl-D-alanine endopeptidase [Betaproteobacteria bacterium]
MVRALGVVVIASSLVVAPVEAAQHKSRKHVSAKVASKKPTRVAKAGVIKASAVKAGKVAHAAALQRTSLRQPEFSRPAGSDVSAAEPGVASRTVVVFDESTERPLYVKNDDDRAQPIASITKLMTAMVVLDAHLPMDEKLTITWDDVDHLRGSSSRVELTREELLRLALMSSENRAAAALGRNYPGGVSAFVRAMNAKAAAIGMNQAHFEDSSGLNGNNRASAMDLVRMVQAAHQYPAIREFSTTGAHTAELNRRTVEFRNTNALVRSPDWDIGLSKTGYIREAGRCLVMHARIAARPVVIVLLDSDGKQTRIGDAARIKKWLETRWRNNLLASG